MFAVGPHTRLVTRDFLSVERDGVFKFHLTLLTTGANGFYMMEKT